MKPIALYELSSVLSYFLKTHGIEIINFRYAGFFIKKHEKQKRISFQPVMPADFIKGSGFSVSPWPDIAFEEYSFCLSRLSKSLTHREKLCTLLLLLDQCHNGTLFYSNRVALLEEIAAKLGVAPHELQMMKQLAIIPEQELEKKITTEKILLLRETDMDVLNLRQNDANDKLPAPIAGYNYLQEEQLAFVRIFNKKARLNGTVIELNKIYPVGEGDVLSFDNRLVSFNGLFRIYFATAEFAPLRINGTENTPKVHFDPVLHKLEITGCSVPENGMVFYSKLSNWLDNYLKTKPTAILVSIRLDYFNTTSSKCILDFLFKLQQYKTEEIDLQIQWHYQEEDEDLEEAGINYSEIVKIPFELRPYA